MGVSPPPPAPLYREASEAQKRTVTCPRSCSKTLTKCISSQVSTLALFSPALAALPHLARGERGREVLPSFGTRWIRIKLIRKFKILRMRVRETSFGYMMRLKMSFESHVETLGYGGIIPRQGASICQEADTDTGEHCHAQGTLLTKTTSRRAPTVSPANQNAPPQSLLNGNSGPSLSVG